jgi:hypothetical protein
MMGHTGITLFRDDGERIYVNIDSIDSVEEIKGSYTRAAFCRVHVKGKSYDVKDSFGDITCRITKAEAS